jgi:hypothetical protein
MMKSCASQKRSITPTGFWFEGANSNGTPLMKPMSRRPREITSMVESSSAQRSGSGRWPIG